MAKLPYYGLAYKKIKMLALPLIKQKTPKSQWSATKFCSVTRLSSTLKVADPWFCVLNSHWVCLYRRIL